MSAVAENNKNDSNSDVLGGFTSGSKITDDFFDSDDGRPSYSIDVQDENPIWFYCAAKGSCNEHKMIGVINPVCMAT